MKRNDEFRLNVISEIDDEIIERATLKRDKLLRRPKVSIRKKIIAFGSLAAMLVMIIGSIFMIPPIPPNDDRQVPVYTGMTVSNVNPVVSQGTASTSSLSSSADGLIDGEPPRYSGDIRRDDGALNADDPFGNGKKPIEDVINSTMSPAPNDEEIYYANPGDDVYITVHLHNPDEFEILSFTLNGTKYTSYMFEYGSDLENLILKVNVGDAQGRVEYTVDQIKYVDGTEIKDVKMEGDKTVSIGVYTDNQPKIEITDLESSLNSISFVASVKDEMNLISLCGGKAQAVLYDGEEIVAVKDITEKNQRITFAGLKQDTVYQYAVAVTYDKLDGNGSDVYTLSKSALYTKAPLLFDSVEVGKSEISFEYLWYSGFEGKKIESVTLCIGRLKVRDVPIDALTVDGLLSDTEYRLVVGYRNGEAKEYIELSFRTGKKEAPKYELKDISKDRYSISFDIEKTDIDGVGSISKIELLLDGVTVFSTDDGSVREFTELIPDKVYTLRIIYVYDLNDGNGVHTGVIYADISTREYEIPTLELSNIKNNGTSFSFDMELVDVSNVGEITSVKMFRGNEEIASSDIKPTIEFAIESAMVEYTVRITYTYDGNDGNGVQTETVVLSSWNPPEGLELDSNGNIVGISSCTDKIMFINKPVIGDAFEGNTTVEEVYFLDGATVAGGFKDCPNLNHVYLSDGVESILPCAFENCVSLEEISLPSSIKRMGHSSFKGCKKLSKVIFSEDTELTVIGDRSFEDCTALKSFIIPKSVTSIEPYAFFCSGLVSVNFGDNSSVTEIGAGAFFKCESLKEIKIPEGVSIINENVFTYCISLKEITVHEGVTSIKDGAFASCFNLTAVVIPDTVSAIGNDVFNSCNKLTVFLTADKIPDSWTASWNPDVRPVITDAVKHKYIFMENGGEEAEDVTAYALAGDPEVKREGYILAGWFDNPECMGEPIRYPYFNSKKNTLYAKWIYLDGNSENEGLEINEFGQIIGIGECTDKVLYLNGPIMDGAFENNKNIEKVYLLGGATSVGSHAFRECASLEYVYVGEGVKQIGEYAFDECLNLESVYISETVEYLGTRAFCGCENMTEVTISENAKITEIPAWCFDGCEKLNSIYIPSTVTTIGECAFYNNDLRIVTFGESSSLQSIDSHAFCGNANLKSIEIPKRVKYVGDGAFCGCSSLEEIVFSDGLTEIGDHAFAGCSALKKAVIPDTVVLVGFNAFYISNDGYFDYSNVVIFYEGTEIPSSWYDNWNPHVPVVLNARESTYSFVSNGGSEVESVKDYGVFEFPTTARDGYIFVGWYDNAELTGEPVKFPYYSSEKLTLYAKWERAY